MIETGLMRTGLKQVSALLLLALTLILALISTLQSVHAAVLPAGPAAPTGIVGKPSWVTPNWAERHLYALRSPLMKNSHTDHVVSLYFFGEDATRQRTLIGLERVKGDDYHQYFSLLVFEQQRLVGYFVNVASFPLGIDAQGVVRFPRGFEARSANSEAIAFKLNNDDFSPLCLADLPCVDWQWAPEPKPRRRSGAVRP